MLRRSDAITAFGFPLADLSGGNACARRPPHRPEDLQQRRGKQDWQPHPHKVWYRRTTGIWQPVWFEQRPATHVAGLTWAPNGPEARLSLAVLVLAWVPFNEGLGLPPH
jgi:hypothetical protein